MRDDDQPRGGRQEGQAPQERSTGEPVTTTAAAGHRHLAEGLERLSPRGNEALIAAEYHAAGDVPAWARWMRRAADSAYRDGGHGAALPHLLELVDAHVDQDLEPQLGPLVPLWLETATAAYSTGQPALALELSELALAARGLSPEEHAHAVLTRSRSLTALADPRGRAATLEAAREVAALPRDHHRAHLRCSAAGGLLGHDQHGHAAELAEAALSDLSGATVEGGGPRRLPPADLTRAACLIVLGAAYAAIDPPASEQWFAQARKAAAAVGTRLSDLQVWLFHAQATAHLLRGQLDDALDLSLEGQTWLTQQQRHHDWAPRLAAVGIEAMVQRGRCSRARRLLAAWGSTPLPDLDRARLDILEARVALLEGRRADAAQLLERWAAIADPPGCAPAVACQWLELAIRVRAGQEGPAGAARLSLEMAQRALALSPVRAHPAIALAVRYAARVRAPARAAAVDRVRSLMGVDEGCPPEVCGPWRALITAELAGSTGPACQEWVTAGQVFRAAQGPQEVRLYVMLREARARLSTGDHATASVLSDAAGLAIAEMGCSTLARCDLELRERLDTPSGPPERRLGLTRREFEVLKLIAQGLTNREIAQHLTISPRTADVHVSRILSKLQASSRTHATAIAVARGSLTLADMAPSSAPEQPSA